jgi:2-C-methyl-D-erythritol 4-phosphate cytidylyltransferase
VERSVVVVAGGSGSRMGAPVPKQFLELQGKPILMHTLQRFEEAFPGIRLIVVLPETQIQTWESLCRQHQFECSHETVAGGETRFQSVQNGLALIEGGLVAVHDGVRPLVSLKTIRETFAEAELTGAAVPVVPVNESVRMVSQSHSKSLDRSQLRIVQTPQVFRYAWMKEAFSQEYSEAFTDCASVLESAGFPISTTEGNAENLKITRPVDLLLAEAILSSGFVF